MDRKRRSRAPAIVFARMCTTIRSAPDAMDDANAPPTKPVAPVMRIVRSVKESARSACRPMVHVVPPDSSPSNNVQMRPRRHVHAHWLTARRRAGQAAPTIAHSRCYSPQPSRAAHARTPAAMSLFPESERFGDVRRVHASVALPNPSPISSAHSATWRSRR